MAWDWKGFLMAADPHSPAYAQYIKQKQQDEENAALTELYSKIIQGVPRGKPMGIVGPTMADLLKQQGPPIDQGFNEGASFSPGFAMPDKPPVNTTGDSNIDAIIEQRRQTGSGMLDALGSALTGGKGKISPQLLAPLLKDAMSNIEAGPNTQMDIWKTREGKKVDLENLIQQEGVKSAFRRPTLDEAKANIFQKLSPEEQKKVTMGGAGKDTVSVTIDGKQTEIPATQWLSHLDRQNATAIASQDRAAMRAMQAQFHADNMALRTDLAKQAFDLRRRIPAQQAVEVSKDQNSINRYSQLINSFEKDFGGSKMLGPTATAFYERVGAKKPRVNWWKEFKMLDNQLRHEIFGATLTGYEKQSWEAVTVNENTDPDIAKAQLQKRLNIAQQNLKRKMDAFGQAGYDVSGIETPQLPTIPKQQQNNKRFIIEKVE